MNKNKMPVVRKTLISESSSGKKEYRYNSRDVQALQSYAENVTEELDMAVEILEKINSLIDMESWISKKELIQSIKDCLKEQDV